MGADGTSTTPKLKIRLIYIGLHLKFYNPSLNNFIIYKLCITEIRVHPEERAYNYQKRALGDPYLIIWLHNFPTLSVPADELGAARAEVYVCVP